jgi:hydrogenase assembly chaperone HypC/HupF
MCLSMPCQLVHRGASEFDFARVQVEGLTREVSLLFFPSVEVGDWVLVQNGHVVERLDPATALAALAAFRELGAPLPPLDSPEARVSDIGADARTSPDPTTDVAGGGSAAKPANDPRQAHQLRSTAVGKT